MPVIGRSVFSHSIYWRETNETVWRTWKRVQPRLDLFPLLEHQGKKNSWPEQWDLKQDLLTSRVAGSTEQEELRVPRRWERIRFYRQGSWAEFYRSRMAVEIMVWNLTFSLGLSLSLQNQPLHGAWLLSLWRSDRVETAGLGLGGSVNHADLFFF